MDSISAYLRGQVARERGDEQRVFDWEKAATIIKKKKVKNADAGLAGDLEWTGGSILVNGKPNKNSDCMYLSSNWARPILIINGEEIECWKYQNEVPRWGANTMWPKIAREIMGFK